MPTHPEQWNRIEQLYNEALERRLDERSSFLAEACRGDEELRREVEALLDHLDRDRSFLSSPAMDHILDTEVLAHYRIVKKLAAGGMGAVYQARDTRLERTVAIKVLNSSLVASPNLRSRFDREAMTRLDSSRPDTTWNAFDNAHWRA